jgi:hypothetical protein
MYRVSERKIGEDGSESPTPTDSQRFEQPVQVALDPLAEDEAVVARELTRVVVGP